MLSKQSIDILIDLVEIKLSTMMVQDKDDLKELCRLKTCKNELMSCNPTKIKSPNITEHILKNSLHASYVE